MDMMISKKIQVNVPVDVDDICAFVNGCAGPLDLVIIARRAILMLKDSDMDRLADFLQEKRNQKIVALFTEVREKLVAIEK